jgi:3'-5' exoribonuclease
MELSDKTGNIKAKAWSEFLGKIEDIVVGKIYSFDGNTQNDSYGLQLNVTKAVLNDKADITDFVAKTSYDKSDMEKDLAKYIEMVKNKHLKALVKNVLNKEFYPKYISSPAAYYIHHAYEGGLLEHTLDMLHMSEGVKTRFPKINYDLLIVGILFHDIGKAFEYTLGSTIGFSKRGKLLGHVYIGTEYVKEHAPDDMPEELLNEVLHMILSHQGEIEFGSPIKPKTVEAVALYHLDNSSTKINAAYNVIHNLEEGTEFAPYHKQLGVELYRSPYLDELYNEDIPF